MSGGAGTSAQTSPIKDKALDAFESGEATAVNLLEEALSEHSHDGSLIIAHAAAKLRAGRERPFAHIANVLNKAPDWIDGHKALARLMAEAGEQNPFEALEHALDGNPKNPRLWMAYLTLLGSAGRHLEAAEHTAKLRRSIADLPELRLVEARHRGFAGETIVAQGLLEGLPAHLPDLNFEFARNAMRQGDLVKAAAFLDEVLTQNPKDIGAWALTELCWRATGDARHTWLCSGEDLFVQSDLGLSRSELVKLAQVLRDLHVTQSAPLGQSVEGGTQTHGNLRLRSTRMIVELFARIDAVLSNYAKRLKEFEQSHPLVRLHQPHPKMIASWSIRLLAGGRHVPHLHDGGLISSAAHIAVPDGLAKNEGALELGLPPDDIPLTIDPLARFEAKPGHLILFPSFVYHSTTRFAQGERLTVAFDAV